MSEVVKFVLGLRYLGFRNLIYFSSSIFWGLTDLGFVWRFEVGIVVFKGLFTF